MELKVLPYEFTVCKLTDAADVDLNAAFCFAARTDEELSLVCRTEDTPAAATDREAGWRGVRIQGILDFSLVGILSAISGILADNGIGIFAVSTFNTDYVFVKAEDLGRALKALADAGYTLSGEQK